MRFLSDKKKFNMKNQKKERKRKKNPIIKENKGLKIKRKDKYEERVLRSTIRIVKGRDRGSVY